MAFLFFLVFIILVVALSLFVAFGFVTFGFLISLLPVCCCCLLLVFLMCCYVCLVFSCFGIPFILRLLLLCLPPPTPPSFALCLCCCSPQAARGCAGQRPPRATQRAIHRNDVLVGLLDNLQRDHALWTAPTDQGITAAPSFIMYVYCCTLFFSPRVSTAQRNGLGHTLA